MADCALCDLSLDEAVLISTTSRHGHASRRVACLQCGLVQVSPQPTEAELLAYYTSHAYRTEHGPVEILVTTPDGIQRLVNPKDDDYEDALDRMAQWRRTWSMQHAGLVAGMRVLEVGSGNGRTLAALEAHGLEVTGIEPDEAEAKASSERLKGGRVFCGPLEAFLEHDEGVFDAIVMFHVLEHLHRPRETLRALRERLTPRGALVIEVPDIMTPHPDVDGTHLQHVHLTDWSQHTLIAALVTEQYEPTWIDTRSNLRCVARPATRSVQYDVPVSGWYVKGYLDGVRFMYRLTGGQL